MLNTTEYLQSEHYRSQLLPTLKYVAQLHARSGGVTEIRVLQQGKTYAGWYDVGEEEQMAKAIAPFVGKANVYFTLNAVRKELLERAHATLKQAPTGFCTTDDDIISIDLFPVDVDPVRDKGHKKDAATVVEKGQAIRRAGEVKNWLRDHGASAIGGDSGNGGHLLVPMLPCRRDQCKEIVAKAKALGEMLAEQFNDPTATIDTGIYNASRIFKLYGTLAMKGEDTPDRPHRWASIDLSNPPAPIDLLEALKDQIAHYRPRRQETVPAGAAGEVIEVGARDTTLTSLAGAMRRRGMTSDEIHAALQQVNRDRCAEPLPDTDLQRIARSIGGKPPGDAHFNLTDAGNAERFAAQHGDRIKFCWSWKKWLYYDGTRWNPETGEEKARHMALQTTRSILADAAATEDQDKRKRVAAWGLQSESNNRIQAILALARSLPDIAVYADSLDAGIFSLNCLNGTIDLTTGQLRDHDAADMLTKLCPVQYDPGARMPLWDDFLRTVTNNDSAMMSFLQAATGYALTGSTQEEKLFFVHGDAATGKSTFVEGLKATLGSYAATADFESFLKRDSVGGPRNDIAKLAGARLVVSVEVDEGKTLAEGLVKMLTGGDTISARFLYSESFEFVPQFKLWLAANHAPRVRDDDEAMWRRILRIPFNHVIPKDARDPTVKLRLRDPEVAGPAILAWAVQGCLKWQGAGLVVPSAVESSTQEYRRSQDPLWEFFQEECKFAPQAYVPVHEMRSAYEQWAKDAGIRYPVGPREFNKRLRARGCASKPKRCADNCGDERVSKCWTGVTLISRTRYDYSETGVIDDSDRLLSKDFAAETNAEKWEDGQDAPF
jgi:putative DNA primase/helicase